MDYYTRPATILDIPEIQEIIRIASKDGVGIEGSEEELLKWQQVNCSRELIESRILDEDIFLLVTEETFKEDNKKKIVGTGYAMIKEDGIGYLGGLYCLVRGEGVGSGILVELIAWLERLGVTSSEMVVAGKNTSMLGLSKKLGFTPAGLVKGEFFPNGTWITLKKTL